MSAVRAAATRLRADVGRAPIAWTYLAIALCWGIGLVLIIPPFQNNDEPEHYFRSWAIAQGQLVPGPGGLVDLPSNVAALNADLHSTEVTQGTQPYRLRTTLDALGDEVAAERVQQFTSTGAESPIGYLPQAFGIEVVRVFGGSPLLGLYVARIATLCVCIALTFVAVRIVPFGSAILALVGLFPMTMTLAASVNPGAVLSAGALLWLALILRLASAGRVQWWDTASLVAIALLVLTIKPGYTPLAALVFLVPPQSFGSRRRYWATMSVCLLGAVGVAGLVVWGAPHVSMAREIARGAPQGIDSGAQVAFIVHHPWAFTRVLFSTVGASALGWSKEAVGLLGRGAVVLSDLVTMVALLGALVLMMRGAEEDVPLRRWQRVLLVLVSLAISAAVMAGLYVEWTPLASPLIQGIQGRYFLPALPCLLLGLYGWRLKTQRRVQWVLVATVLVMVAGTLYAVIRHYY
jgi:uncharacterized membrane protein